MNDSQIIDALRNDSHLSEAELNRAERIVFGMVKNLESRGLIDWRMPEDMNSWIKRREVTV